MNSLCGQSLLQHIIDGDCNAVNALLTNGIVNLDERDEVIIMILIIIWRKFMTLVVCSRSFEEKCHHSALVAA